MRKVLTLALLSLLVWACGGKKVADNTTDSTLTVSSDSTKNDQMTNRFGDDTLVTIYNYQNARDSKALVSYLTNANPTYREAATIALASVQDTTLIDTLENLFKDQEAKVRIAAVYAMGQTGKLMKDREKVENALLRAWESDDQDKQVKIKVLEALGKVATKKGLDYMTSMQIKDEDLYYGFALGVFRAGQNRVFNDTLNESMINLIGSSHEERVREIASHHLARFGRLAKGLGANQEQLVQAMASDQHPFVRMNCARALSQVKSPVVQRALINTIQNDENYLVRVNAIRSYRMEYDSVRTAMMEALNDKNEHVAISASQYLLRNAPEEEADTLFQMGKKHPNWMVKVNLLTLANKFDKEDQVSKYVQTTYRKSQNVYEKSYLLKVLANKVDGYGWIADKLYNEDNKVIRTFAIDALSQIRRLPDFDKVKEDSVKKDFGKIFKYAIESKDVGLIYYASQVLRDDKLGYKKFYKDRSFLKNTLDSLKLPIDIEAYQQLQQTLDYFNGKKKSDPIPTETKKDIDWKMIKELPQLQKVQLKTSKGNIVFELFVNESPVSVATFVSLAKKGFYNGKTFHRVIANFVAQGGCPRGDGFGGLDYSITSEFAPLYYGTGYVGLASAGKDTESCQWFITHSPTPHLDGSYTIFAKVAEGMDVVHKLQIGDKIEKVEVIKEAQ